MQFETREVQHTNVFKSLHHGSAKSAEPRCLSRPIVLRLCRVNDELEHVCGPESTLRLLVLSKTSQRRR